MINNDKKIDNFNTNKKEEEKNIINLEEIESNKSLLNKENSNCSREIKVNKDNSINHNEYKKEENFNIIKSEKYKDKKNNILNNDEDNNKPLDCNENGLIHPGN